METYKAHNLKRNILNILLIVVIVFVTLQFVGPEVEYRPIAGEFNDNEDVQKIFEKSCYDCHSNKTKLKWFDKIAPGSWLVATDVKNGRAGLNFTEWDSLAPPIQKVKLWEAYQNITIGAMPLKSYEIMHPEAKLTPTEIMVLKRYLLSLSNQDATNYAQMKIYQKQFAQWNKDTPRKDVHPVTTNGIYYIPKYQDWLVLSTSERFDNGTMRVIYGNDIARKAIRENNINPWPDGTIFIKVAWASLQDKDGKLTTGEFKNFQYMIKDKVLYAATKGWGFARFDGLEKKPFGDKGFEYSCINCHLAVENNDYVFTRPIK